MSAEQLPCTLDDLSEMSEDHLEWNVLLDRIAATCASSVGAERVRALRPFASLSSARDRIDQVREALEAADQDLSIPRMPLPMVLPQLERIRRGGVASGPELRNVIRFLELSRQLRGYARTLRDQWPHLAHVLESDPALDRLEARLDAAITIDGSVADAASSELLRARRRVEAIRQSVVKVLAGLVERYAEVLRDRTYVERDQRYTLPVRADAHLRVPGIVLGSSGSGNTLYVEPREVTDLGNQLRLAEVQVEREVARVLAELSQLLEQSADLVLLAHEACVEADVLGALVGFARATDGSIPELCSDPVVSLKQMRHPLLALAQLPVVPNDMSLRGGTALVLSGPNAGGKTVVLKCLGLAVLMAQSGLPLPSAPGSKVGWFSLVLSDMGDAQSIPQSLSTFSAHVSHLASLLRYATDRTLILLDEVAAGTDPDEGSALAAALLEALIDKQAAVAVTTHYERLKELAARTEGFVNASVGFDLDSFIPNFRLLPDTPGPSTALAVARRFGIPEVVVDRARSLLERPAVDREEVLARLHADRKALEEARRDAEGERARQRELSARLTSEIEAAKDRQRSRLARESDELFDEIRSARAELRRLRASLSEKSATQQSVRRAERSVDQVARHLALGGRIAEHIRPSSTASAPVAQRLSPGMHVRVRRLGAVGTVLEAEHRGQVRIQVGSLRMSSPVEELDLIDGRPPAQPVRPAKRSTDRKLSPGLSGVTEVLRTSDNTLDIRGLRVDEAEAEVDGFIDQLLRTRNTYGFVLHGHGTGALKSAVRSHLAASKHVVRSRPAEPGEGGDAFTVLWIEG